MRSKLVVAALLAGLSTPAFAEIFSVSGLVQGIASGTPQGPALRAYVREGDADVLDGCQDKYAFVTDLSEGAATKQQLITQLYYSGQQATLSIEKDEMGWCQIVAVAATI
ncbi:hypothetical protein MOK15_09900 [Sphingobium sp. BYY-5]|uniref:hypothetical protein n=1 Tax=Sphingobium sp. BYY-5 TaxID=2926400 RepID=UPI001FA71D6A|nr:hypothetical protein [Sphingobium sp. BYY-5]MCI4590406.1 hypothetical protein [Sphingobium sp. BYY-5]